MAELKHVLGGASAALPPTRLDGRDILVLSPSPTAPQDAGNRKRIYRICSELKRRGARIHFVYYAFEWADTYVPQVHHEAMAGQWDSFHLAPVTRALQSPPAGKHHTIDEWWDAAGIEPMLHWLFQRGTYDAFIVNYAYLSRALELAPMRTIKILDTHDRFSDRLDLLHSMGLAPEYFYTTVEEESRALNRADLVWAIKEEEAEFFRTLTDKPVLTMPHCDPALALPPRTQDDTQELVLGMVGARNSINVRNAELFINEVLPILRRYLAPVKVRFGGGMCEALAEWPELPSGVELAGRFGQPEEFYSTVDAVLVPLAQSTGLKIKAVEAFSVGLPVIAHRHSVEGVPTDHPFHACDTPQQIAQCCLELAFDRSRLAELRQASIDTCEQLSRQLEAAMDATAHRIAKRPVIVITVAPEMVLGDTAYGQHVREAIDYLRHLCDVVLYADRPLAEGFGTWSRAFSWRASWLKMVLSPEAAAAMGVGADRRVSVPFPLFHSVERFGDVVARLPRGQVWLLDLPAELEQGRLPPGALNAGYLRVDTIRALGLWSDETVAGVLRANPDLTAVCDSGCRTDPVLVLAPRAKHLLVPYWTRATAWSRPGFKTNGPVWITTSPDSLTWASGLQRALGSLWPDKPAPVLVWPAGQPGSVADGDPKPGDACDGGVVLDRALELLQLPACVVDAAGWLPAHSVLRETMQRAGVPWVPGVRLAGQTGIQTALDDVGEPASVGDLIQLVVDAVQGGRKAVRQVASAYRNDAGWQAVWKAIASRTALY